MLRLEPINPSLLRPGDDVLFRGSIESDDYMTSIGKNLRVLEKYKVVAVHVPAWGRSKLETELEIRTIEGENLGKCLAYVFASPYSNVGAVVDEK